MRRTPPTDSTTLVTAGGPATEVTSANFDSAFRELADARAAYDRVAGDPDSVPSLAFASARLAAARRDISVLRTAA